MKNKILLIVLTFVCALCGAAGLTACFPGGADDADRNILQYALNADGESYSVSANPNWWSYLNKNAEAEIVIPAAYRGKPVTAIADGGFGGSTIDNISIKITVPDSVTKIGQYAFSGNDKLVKVNIPSGVTEIGDYAFSDCEKLTGITIPDKITRIGERTFENCKSLESVVIPDSVISIGDNAFYHCNFSSLTMGNGVKSIGERAFEHCTNFTDLTLPDSLTDIGFMAFSGIRVRTVKAPAFAFSTEIAVGNQYLKTAVITGGGELPGNAFNYCTNLESVTVPSGITSIGEGAFSSCTSLKSITLPESVASIREGAFTDTGIESAEIYARHCSSLIVNGNKKLKSVVISGGAEIDGESFNGSYLTSVTIPGSVTAIENGAFTDCNKLTEIKYAGDIAGWCKIKGLENLPKKDRSLIIGGKKAEGVLALPQEVTAVPDYAFAYCPEITAVLISSAEVRMGFYSFWQSGVATVYFKGTQEEWTGSNIQSGDVTLAKRYYYSASKPAVNGAGTDYGGSYWHYAADGVTPERWVFQSN